MLSLSKLLRKTTPWLCSLLFASLCFGTNVSAAFLRLNWGQSSGTVDGYKIDRFDGTAFVEIFTAESTTLTYVDSGLLPATQYCYIVRAFNVGGVSDPTNAGCATTLADAGTLPPPSPPPPPPPPPSPPPPPTPPPPTPTPTRISGKWADYNFSVKIRSNDVDTMGVMFRYQDNGNYYRFSWSRRGKFRRLEKMENSTVTVLAEDNVLYVRRKTYQLQVSANGAALEIAIDGKPIFSVTDASIPGGTIALYSSFNGASRFDDVVVHDLTTGTVLLSDDFSGGQSRGWSMIDDPPLAEGTSVWSTSSGALVHTGNIGSNTVGQIGTYALYTQGSWSDYRTSLKLTSFDNDCMGVMFRVQDNHNYYRLSWCAEGNFRRRLEKIEDDALTVLAQDVVPPVIGQTYQVQIVARGESLDVAIDGTPIFSVTDSSFAAGSIALYSWWNAGSAFDDLLVENLATGAVLLWDDFDDGNIIGWTPFDEGTTNGPSDWSIQNGALIQSSDIGSVSMGNLGTFALY